MSLKNTRILIDGYHLQMNRGTGITTYSLTLLESLLSLEAEVSILYGLPLPKVNDKKLQAILFLSNLSLHDQQVSTTSFKQQIKNFLKNTLTVASTFNPALLFTQTVEIDIPQYVQIPEKHKYLLSNIRSIYNRSQCFDFSNLLLKFLGINYAVSIPSDNKPEIFHATYPTPINIPQTKKITTIHDLIPIKIPELTLMDKKYFYNLVKNAIKTSSLVFTISEATKNDLLQFYDIAPEKIVVTYQPVNNSLVNLFNYELQADEKIIYRKIAMYSLKPEKYILFVGTIEPKKNVKRLIEAFLSLDSDLDLVIVGQKGWLFDDVFSLYERLLPTTKSRIHFLNFVSKSDLAYLYAGAIAFVFPSLYEGFGLPPLEAMSFDCPVITSNLSSLPEVCGDAAIYVDPYSVSSIANGIAKVIDNPELREKLIQKGKDRVEYFSIKNYEKRLLEGYQKVVKS